MWCPGEIETSIIGRCAGCRPGGSLCPIVHSLERLDSTGVSTWLLRKQNLLRYIGEEHRSSIAATREEWFSARVECDMRARDRSNSSKSDLQHSAFCFDQRDFSRAFSAAARGPLHVSHLIQKR